MNNPKRVRWDIWFVITLSTFALFILFFVFPVYKIFINSIYDAETKRFTLAAFEKFFARQYYTSTIWNSLKVTLLVTLLAAALGTVLAYIMRTVKIKGKGMVEIIIIITVLSPPFIGAYSWILLLGRSGVITKFINRLFDIEFNGIYGFYGILLVLTLKLFPLIYLFVSGALKNMDNSLNEAAENLGSVGLHKIVKVVIPLILPTLLAASLLVFMRALADFGTPMLIGEGYRTLPVLIYTSFVAEMGGDAAFAAAISVVVVIMTTLIFLLQKYISNRSTVEMSALRPMEPEPAKGAKNIISHLVVYLVVLLAAIPQAVVIFTSFLKTNGRIFTSGFSFDSYIHAFSKMGSAITNTYLFSFTAILIILVIGTLIAYISVRKKNVITETLDTLTMIPYIIPGSVLGIALLAAFNKKPLLLSGSAFIIIAVYVIRRLPYTIRSSSAILRQINPSVEEAAQSLGASPFKTFRKVTLPMMVPGIVSGALMSWMTVISELSASIILYVGTTRTLTISIYTEVIRGNYGVAAALSAILSATTVIALLLFFKITGKKEIQL
ncbi:iron ABC transporter permease [Paenibacillus sp. J2TS4]|uniref:ABC transporter permease n=1 Tax=Paenibacillus sp. J2TS4 TaxID=2807194 RepID=UPI001B29FF60|nr:iron ABC transporter permease [Paenibacillus sp. J2TS4]GIP36507.1 iron ABC transporter permease [Paenibacillus sp. J2TS4]